VAVLAPPGAGIVAAKQIYGQTHRLVALRPDGAHVDVADLEGLREAVKGRALVVVETLSNPNLAVADLPAICEIAHAAGARVLVDNTVATPVNCRPLEWGADMVMHSATKYLNGHSDVLAGVAAGPAALIEDVHTASLELGATLSPDSAWLVRRGIRTLHLRVERACQNAMRVAEFLEAHSRVTRVVYPGLPSHPAHAVARRILDGFGGMLAFEVDGGEAGVRAFLEGLRCFSLAESLGGVESLVAHPATMTHASMSPEARAIAGISDQLIRLSIGIEDADDLVADVGAGLERALATLDDAKRVRA